jgi:hypothetical protein
MLLDHTFCQNLCKPIPPASQRWHLYITYTAVLSLYSRVKTFFLTDTITDVYILFSSPFTFHSPYSSLLYTVHTLLMIFLTVNKLSGAWFPLPFIAAMYWWYRNSNIHWARMEMKHKRQTNKKYANYIMIFFWRLVIQENTKSHH